MAIIKLFTLCTILAIASGEYGSLQQHSPPTFPHFTPADQQTHAYNLAASPAQYEAANKKNNDYQYGTSQSHTLAYPSIDNNNHKQYLVASNLIGQQYHHQQHTSQQSHQQHIVPHRQQQQQIYNRPVQSHQQAAYVAPQRKQQQYVSPKQPTYQQHEQQQYYIDNGYLTADHKLSSYNHQQYESGTPTTFGHQSHYVAPSTNHQQQYVASNTFDHNLYGTNNAHQKHYSSPSNIHSANNYNQHGIGSSSPHKTIYQSHSPSSDVSFTKFEGPHAHYSY